MRKSNPTAVRYIVMLMAFYLHLGPFASKVIAAIDARLAELDLAVAARSISGGSHASKQQDFPVSSGLACTPLQ